MGVWWERPEWIWVQALNWCWGRMGRLVW